MVDWRALEEEARRPIPAAKRTEFTVSWRRWPDGCHERKSLETMTREELDDLGWRLVAALMRHAEGPLTMARLLARLDRMAEAG